MFFKPPMPTADTALAGRDEAIETPNPHRVLGDSLNAPFPPNTESIQFGMGCFWGAERRFWQQEQVVTTAVGYAGGFTPNPTYEEVCAGQTGHTEVVLVVYEGGAETLERLLALFWESHDPTQGMQQGNDSGTQYRSSIYASSPEQLQLALASRDRYQAALTEAGLAEITTEVKDGIVLYYAEDYHQQYLDKNPGGYCGLRGTGVCL